MTTIVEPPQALTITPRRAHSATVIFIHGLGDTGFGWLPVTQAFASDPELDHVKWVLPHAPRRPVTVNAGTIMPSWFDILEIGSETRQDTDGILESARAIDALIEVEANAARHIVLGGFSQGATLTFITGLTSQTRLAGLAALSGRVTVRDVLKESLSSHAKNLPLFIAHGTTDPLVRPETVLDGVRFLRNEIGLLAAESLGTPGISIRTYEGLAHSASEQELEDLKAWLKSVIPKSLSR